VPKENKGVAKGRIIFHVDMDQFYAAVKELVERTLFFKTVTIKIRYENFETHTHGKALSLFTNNLQVTQRTARELIQPYLSKNRKIRLAGVRTSNFTSSKEQKTLA